MKPDETLPSAPRSSPSAGSAPEAGKPVSPPGLAPQEFRKRKREIFAIVALASLFLILTFIEFKLVGISQQLPFMHSIFFFGLVNFNIILLLLLFFLIFRNVVKVFVESSGRAVGSSLKGKLIAAFVAFASVPTALMFLISVFYINSSFDKWFSVRMASVLKNSLEVNQEYVFAAKNRNYHFAKLIAQDLRSRGGRAEPVIADARRRYDLDSVEYYPGLFAARVLTVADDDVIPPPPPVSLEFLRKGILQRAESSTIHQFGEGNLVRVIVPIQRRAERGAIVVSTFIPISLISKIDDISAAYEEFRNLNPLEYPLKSIYLIILSLMTLVILLCATWFGFYLARELSIPLEVLGSASRRVGKGDYQPVGLRSGSKEINQLVASFNAMVGQLDRSKREVLQANKNLTETLERLDEHSRYIQVVLSNVTTGVISVDQDERITTVNRHAAQLLEIEPQKYVGRKVGEVLSAEYFQLYRELLRQMRAHGFVTFQKEIRVDLKDRSVPLQVNLALLQDERGQDLGKVLVFDDLTMLLNAQRAAAWTEVARRIAHEIKNPLTPIKLSAQRLEKKFGDQIKDPAFSSCIGMIIRQTDELKHLVNEFSNFARLPQTKPVLASLHQVCVDVLDMYRAAHRDVSFEFETEGQTPEFRFDPEQIRRVLINLIDNAVAAVQQQPSPKVILRLQYDASLKLVRLMIIDNGPGIPAADRDRVFEPYFSTKESGTGLGLAIVRRIIEDHNGFVRALANEPQGAKLLLELPVNEVSEPTGAERVR